MSNVMSGCQGQEETVARGLQEPAALEAAGTNAVS
jgi:hypothetical protein